MNKKAVAVIIITFILQQTYSLEGEQTQNELSRPQITEQKESDWYSDEDFEFPYGLVKQAIDGSEISCAPGSSSCNTTGCITGTAFGLLLPTEAVYYKIKNNGKENHYFGASHTLGVQHYISNSTLRLGCSAECSLDLCIGTTGPAAGLKAAAQLETGFSNITLSAGYAAGTINKTCYLAPTFTIKYRHWNDNNIIATWTQSTKVKRFSVGVRGRL